MQHGYKKHSSTESSTRSPSPNRLSHTINDAVRCLSNNIRIRKKNSKRSRIKRNGKPNQPRRYFPLITERESSRTGSKGGKASLNCEQRRDIRHRLSLTRESEFQRLNSEEVAAVYLRVDRCRFPAEELSR